MFELCENVSFLACSLHSFTNWFKRFGFLCGQQWHTQSLSSYYFVIQGKCLVKLNKEMWFCSYVCLFALSSSLWSEKLWAEASEWACGSWRSSVAVGHNPSPRRQQRPFPSLFTPTSSLRTRSQISSSPRNWSAAPQRSPSPLSLSTAPSCAPPPLTTPSAARAPEHGAAKTPAALASSPAWRATPATSRSRPTVTSSR